MTDFLRGIAEFLDLAPWRIPMIVWMTAVVVILVGVFEALRAWQ